MLKTPVQKVFTSVSNYIKEAPATDSPQANQYDKLRLAILSAIKERVGWTTNLDTLQRLVSNYDTNGLLESVKQKKSVKEQFSRYQAIGLDTNLPDVIERVCILIENIIKEYDLHRK